MALKDNLEVRKTFLTEALSFWRNLRQYNASSCTDKDIEKMQYTLLRENHTIEKGLSLRNPRKGFGKQKVSHLLQGLQQYWNLYEMQNAACKMQDTTYTATDDCGMVHHFLPEIPIYIVEGEEKNKKITFKEDLEG